MTKYYGNGSYCYANSASMLLDSIGEKISPSLIEVLTGFSLGASILNDMLYFDNCLSSPDKGVNKAFQLLGFSVVEKVSEAGATMPIQELKEALQQGPVMLGPFDMGYLKYNPNHPYLKGCDHYVLAIEVTDNHIVLHDPSGFPYVSLPLSQLELAWRADAITWSSGSFRYWYNPKRIARPSKDELYKRAIHMFKADYEQQLRHASQHKLGNQAIQYTAQKNKGGKISNSEKAHLTHFAFPLGARRATDYAQYFKENHVHLADLKDKQAQLLGQCYTLSISNQWNQISDLLDQLADIEDKFKTSMLTVNI